MAFRWISSVVIALALNACAGGGFSDGARQFSGVWLYEFEGSGFVEGATGMPTERPPYEETDWLEWTEWPHLESLMEERLGDGDCYTVQPFLITFIGRRSHHPFGGVGHMGLMDSKVTVLRPISAERLGPSFCYDR
jgi:hypothetical protein